MTSNILFHGPVIADRAKPGSWEQWTLEVYADKIVSIRSCHELYLCAEPSGKVIADRKVAGPWEKWTFEACEGLITLQSRHGRYLSVDPSGKVTANSKEAGPWETFRLIDYDGKVRNPESYLNELCALGAVMKRDEGIKRAAAVAGGDEAAAEARMRLVGAGFPEFAEGIRNVAVVGLAGAGKSTFVNFVFKGAGKRTEGVPVTRMVKTTHPELPHVAIWELPGVEKRDTVSGMYWKDTCLDAFDAIALVVNGRKFSKFCEQIVHKATASRKPFLVVHMNGSFLADQISKDKKITLPAANVELRMRTKAAVLETFGSAADSVRVFCIEGSCLRPDEWALDERELMEHCFGWLSGGGLPSAAGLFPL